MTKRERELRKARERLLKANRALGLHQNKTQVLGKEYAEAEAAYTALGGDITTLRGD